MDGDEIFPVDPARRFCRIWLLTLLALGLAAAGFVLAIDPYFVFGTRLIDGFNRYKPATLDRIDLAKSHMLPRVAPVTLLLGTSKMECGIDPTSRSFPAGGTPIFNGGVPGTNSAYAYRELKDALRVAPVRRVLLLLEIAEFLPPARAEDDTPPGDFLPGWRDQAREKLLALLSLDALRDSASTLAEQHGRPSGIDENGLMSDEYFLYYIRQQGPAALFEQKLHTEVAAVDTIAQRVRADPRGNPANLVWISRIIALSRQHGIALDIAIAPVHADLLRLIDRKGLWPRLALAKRALTETVRRDGDGKVALWDFSGFDRYSTEAVPPHGALTPPMAWFWEPNHFRRALGEKMLATIYRGGGEFGTRLTNGNMAAVVARDEDARQKDRIEAAAENARLTRQVQELAAESQ